MYADDITLMSAAEDPDTLQVKMNSDLDTIKTWLKVNKLTLNVKKKPKFMFIGSRPKVDLFSNNFAVKVDNISIERVTVYKSLGVSVDEDLTWKAYVEEISKKISAGLSVLKIETREIMYKALFLPYFDYSSCVWGHIGIRLTEKLRQLQNRATRIVTLSSYETRCKDLLGDLGSEVPEDRRMRKLAILIYKITHDISPPCLRNIFQNVSDVHS